MKSDMIIIDIDKENKKNNFYNSIIIDDYIDFIDEYKKNNNEYYTLKDNIKKIFGFVYNLFAFDN